MQRAEVADWFLIKQVCSVFQKANVKFRKDEDILILCEIFMSSWLRWQHRESILSFSKKHEIFEIIKNLQKFQSG